MCSWKLLLISFLHQTTTHSMLLWKHGELLLISFLHQTTTARMPICMETNCFLSHFYIKPQHCVIRCYARTYCFLSHFYIKPQLTFFVWISPYNCFLSHFYIKPQLLTYILINKPIASYLISTSNHNMSKSHLGRSILLLISFLHQTTTIAPLHSFAFQLLLISFLHQTTTASANFHEWDDCFLSHFYIKPQRILYNPLIYNELWHVAHIRSGWIFLLRQQKY